MRRALRMIAFCGIAGVLCGGATISRPAAQPGAPAGAGEAAAVPAAAPSGLAGRPAVWRYDTQQPWSRQAPYFRRREPGTYTYRPYRWSYDHRWRSPYQTRPPHWGAPPYRAYRYGQPWWRDERAYPGRYAYGYGTSRWVGSPYGYR